AHSGGAGICTRQHGGYGLDRAIAEMWSNDVRLRQQFHHQPPNGRRLYAKSHEKITAWPEFTAEPILHAALTGTGPAHDRFHRPVGVAMLLPQGVGDQFRIVLR